MASTIKSIDRQIKKITLQLPTTLILLPCQGCSGNKNKQASTTNTISGKRIDVSGNHIGDQVLVKVISNTDSCQDSDTVHNSGDAGGSFMTVATCVSKLPLASLFPNEQSASLIILSHLPGPRCK